MAKVVRNEDSTMSLLDLTSDQVAAIGAALDLALSEAKTIRSDLELAIVQTPEFRALVRSTQAIVDAMGRVNRGEVRTAVI